jgi:transcriptional regulator
MYVPTVFAETDKARLHDFIDANSFGLLVSTHGGEPFATHLPFLLERDTGPHGCLVGHMARANPQWHDLDGQQVLAVFSGPHAYISPTWYESANVVPTWSYVAVHAYGICRLIHDPEGLSQILKASVATFERSMPRPWTLDTGTDYIEKLLKAIVGFRIEISRLEGKWKVSQNHPEERRWKVVRVLEQSADADVREIARLVREKMSPASTAENAAPAIES